jgi:hypothetical protein
MGRVDVIFAGDLVQIALYLLDDWRDLWVVALDRQASLFVDTSWVNIISSGIISSGIISSGIISSGIISSGIISSGIIRNIIPF